MKLAVVAIVDTDSPLLIPEVLTQITAETKPFVRAAVVEALQNRLDRIVMVTNEDEADLMCAIYDKVSDLFPTNVLQLMIASLKPTPYRVV